MCSMKEAFYHRYMLLSSVERRVGGQGLVQFASIVNTQDKVRPVTTSSLSARRCGTAALARVSPAVLYREVPATPVMHRRVLRT